MDKLNDCYFYFYSTCTKGKKCPFRHCDLALGSEVVCELWRVGRCKDLNCPFRHMEPNIKRTLIPCWFETQPGGCRKPHCVFQHAKSRPSITDVQPGQDLILPTGGSSTNLQNVNQNNLAHPAEGKLVNIECKIPQKSEINISFERDEESDHEDQENNVEPKVTSEEVKVKTLEQIRMEKILNSSPEESNHENVNKVITSSLGVIPIRANENVNKLKDFKPPENLLTKSVKMNITNGNKETTCPLMDGKEDCTFIIKTLDQIRKERNEVEKAMDQEEKPTLKESQTSNLLKRSIEIDEDGSIISRPIKIRRNRTSTSTNNLLPDEMSKPNEIPELNMDKPEKVQSETLHATQRVDKINLPNEDLDFDEFDLDGVPSGGEDLDVSSDDDLMREIDQVINS